VQCSERGVCSAVRGLCAVQLEGCVQCSERGVCSAVQLWRHLPHEGQRNALTVDYAHSVVRLVLNRARKTKVSDLHHSLLTHKHISGCQVTVDNALFRLSAQPEHGTNIPPPMHHHDNNTSGHTHHHTQVSALQHATEQADREGHLTR